MNRIKESRQLCGNLIRPVTIGSAAVFSSEGLLYRTSPVTALHEQTKNYIHFETENTHYHLSIQPVPQQTAGSLFPMRLSACA